MAKFCQTFFVDVDNDRQRGAIASQRAEHDIVNLIVKVGQKSGPVSGYTEKQEGKKNAVKSNATTCLCLSGHQRHQSGSEAKRFLEKIQHAVLIIA